MNESKDKSRSVRGVAHQIDPGDAKPTIVWVDTLNPAHDRLMGVVVTSQLHASHHTSIESCSCYRGAAERLARAERIRIQHKGSLTDEVFREQWHGGNADQRLPGVVQMPTDVKYRRLTTACLKADSGPPTRGVFYERVASDHEDQPPLRLHLTLSDTLQSMTWYHAGGEHVRYLVPSGSTLELQRVVDPSWEPGPWWYWSWPGGAAE